MKTRPLAKVLALCLSMLLLAAALPLSSLVSAASVTLDVTNDALTVSSTYPVSVQVSDIAADRFSNDTTNLVPNSTMKVYDGSMTESTDTHYRPAASGGRGDLTTLYDGLINVGGWAPYEENPTGYYKYSYWYSNMTLVGDGAAKAYFVVELDGEYTIDDFYIMSSSFAKGTLAKYDVYFSSDRDTLFNADNKAITYDYTGYSNNNTAGKLNTVNNNQNAEGQIYTFTDDEAKPTAKYVGFAIREGGVFLPNAAWVLISELGIHGEKNVPTTNTTSYELTIEDAANLHSSSLIAGLSAINTQSGIAGWKEGITDGTAANFEGKTYAHYDIYSETTGVTTASIVYDLGTRNVIEGVALWETHNTYKNGFDVYVGDDVGTLFDDANKAGGWSALENTSAKTIHLQFAPVNQKTGRYVGFKFTDNNGNVSVRLAEVQVYGYEYVDTSLAALDLSELNDETFLTAHDGDIATVGEEFKFTVNVKNGGEAVKAYADGTLLAEDNGVFTIPSVTADMKITVETDRDDYATTNDVWKGVDLSLNDSLYGKAIWDKDATYNESFMLYAGRDSVKMLYPIDEIVSVRSYDLQTVYWKGEDFDIVDGELVPLADGRMKVYATPEDIKNKTSTGGTNYTQVSTWNSTSHNYQYYITYTHSEEWEGTTTYNETPKSVLADLGKFYTKVKSGEATEILFYGDSITVGMNASGVFQPSLRYSGGADASTLSTYNATMYGNLGLTAVPEWGCDSYPVQVVDNLKKAFNNQNITMINKAVGSSHSVWGSKEANLDFLIGDTSPDLLVLAYGMNESNNTAAFQNANIKTIIDYVRELNPDCSVLIVSAFYPNWWDGDTLNPYRLGVQEEGYYDLLEEYDNIAVAPVFSMFESMLTAKEPCDYTSNLYNHPNDFGSRIYGDLITTLLTPDAVKQAPLASMFDFTAPTDLVTDGNQKNATVEAKDGTVGIGAIVVKYYKDMIECLPIEPGTYTVKINVAEGDLFAAVEGLTDEGWTFTIEKAAQNAPSGLGSTAETISGLADGKITGLTTDMEIATSADGDYSKVTDVDMTLAAGTYYVRLAETNTYKASAPATVTVEAGEKLKVTYMNGEEEVAVVEVDYGKDATAPAVPAKEGYTGAWDKDGKNITADTVINAVYTVSKYTVTYKAGDTVVDTQTVEHGNDATAPTVPAKEGYTAAWDKDGKNITADTVINAVYTAIPGEAPDGGETPDGGNTPGTTDKPEVPATGDSVSPFAWIIVAMVGLLGMLSAVFFRRRTAK